MTIVKLPAVYKIEKVVNKQKIWQLAELGQTVEGTLPAFSNNRIRGRLLVPADTGPEVLIVSKKSTEYGGHKYVIKTIDTLDDSVINLADAQWLEHPSIQTQPDVQSVLTSWKDAFHYRSGSPITEDSIALRDPQLGAVHAVLAHWSQSNDLATIVMPTGTGKTDTMISIMVSAVCEKILIIVPTDALRIQLTEKIGSLGILKHPTSSLLDSRALFPSVCALRNRPKQKEDVDEICAYAQVVVTTSSIISGCSEDVIDSFVHHFTHLFIDEAHHAQAPSWKLLRSDFESRRVLQFTATPYRQDGQLLEGKIVYRYSLRQAQVDGYFKPIRFKSVVEFRPDNVDAEIARVAILELRASLENGHILMARVDSIERAEEVYKIYKQHADLNPVQIHTGIPLSIRRVARQQIIDGEARIVVCVDMLGEGFDLPELKIAAFHDIRKSLAVTLQLAGRFTRTSKGLGDAVFIANTADVVVCLELRKLYTREPDWNALLPELADEVVDQRMSLQDFLEGFSEHNNSIPMRSLFPACSAVVYRTECSQWNPDNFREGLTGLSSREHLHHLINHHNHTLVVISGQRAVVPWTDVSETFDWQWELIVVVWIPDQALLYINSSSNAGEYASLAYAVAGNTAEIVSGQDVFKVFSGVNRLRLNNVGLSEQLGRNVRYTGRMGGNVEPALSELQKRKTTKSVLAGSGFENGAEVTIAASKKGKIWSHRRERIDRFVAWCRSVGVKLLDESIDPDNVIKGTLTTITIYDRPNKVPVGIDWPETIYSEYESRWEFECEGKIYPLCEVEIRIASYEAQGPITFSFNWPAGTEAFELQIYGTEENPQYRYVCLGSARISIKKYQSTRITQFDEFMNQEPPKIWFSDGSNVEGNLYLELPELGPPFDKSRLLTWDWQGINIRKESQGVERDSRSIQYRVIENLMKEGYSIIVDDDGCGEAADVVAIRINDQNNARPMMEIDFYHCKYSKSDSPGARVGDLYEVCGQTQKSIAWASSLEKKQI